MVSQLRNGPARGGISRPHRNRKAPFNLLLSFMSAWIALVPWTHVAAPVPRGQGQAAPPGNIVELSGRIVDDRTSQPVTLFALQWGESKDLDSEITWGYGLTAALTPHRDGTFQISRPFTAGHKVALRILADGYLPQAVTEPLIGSARISNLVVRLKPGFELRGIVLDHAGQPVDSARIYLAGNQLLDLEDGAPRTFRDSTAITDSLGNFIVAGGGASQLLRIVASASQGRLLALAPARLGEQVLLRLPQPARLLIRYDMPGSEAEAQLHLDFAAEDMEEWDAARLRMSLAPTIRNGEEIELAVMPGRYRFARGKIVTIGEFGRGFGCDLREIVLAPGETQTVDLIRRSGHSIEGEVSGLKESGAAGAILTVRAADATGDPRNFNEVMSVSDAVSCNLEDGRFRTGPVPPGTYTAVAEAYLPETPAQRNSTGIRLPDFIGTAKVTIVRNSPPLPVKIGLRPVK